MAKRSAKKSRGRPKKSQTKRKSECNKKKMSPCKKSKGCNWVRGKSKGSKKRRGYCRKSPKKRSRKTSSKKKASFTKLTGYSPRIVKTPSVPVAPQSSLSISPINPPSVSSSNTSAYSLGNVENIANITQGKSVAGIPVLGNKDVVGINVGNNNIPIALQNAMRQYPIGDVHGNQINFNPLFDPSKKGNNKGKKTKSMSSSSSSSSGFSIDPMEHSRVNSITSYILDKYKSPDQLPHPPGQNPLRLNLQGLNSPPINLPRIYPPGLHSPD